jgi:hypothetical protein
MRFKLLIISSILILFSACSLGEYELTEDDIFRVNSLYEHTIMMVELSTPEKLKELSLNGANLKRDPLLSSQDKIKLLEEAYYVDLGNKRLDKKINLLEEKMVELMENWS